jgi:hypothetical protein
VVAVRATRGAGQETASTSAPVSSSGAENGNGLHPGHIPNRPVLEVANWEATHKRSVTPAGKPSNPNPASRLRVFSGTSNPVRRGGVQ